MPIFGSRVIDIIWVAMAIACVVCCLICDCYLPCNEHEEEAECPESSAAVETESGGFREFREFRARNYQMDIRPDFDESDAESRVSVSK